MNEKTKNILMNIVTNTFNFLISPIGKNLIHFIGIFIISYVGAFFIELIYPPNKFSDSDFRAYRIAIFVCMSILWYSDQFQKDKPKPTNEHDIDNKLRILKEEINSDILQKLSGKIDADLEVALKKHFDAKLDMNIIETLGERVQSVSSDFALAKRLSSTVEQAYERIARLNSGYHALYEKFLKSYRFFGILFALLGVGVPFLCLWFHIEHIINNDISYLEKFTYHIYLPIIPFTFLCVSLSIIMFSLSSKAQEKIESYTKELNTLLMKATGARLLIETTDKEQMIKAGEKFMDVERNFVLKKGERTIEQGNNELNLDFLEKQNNMMMSLITELRKSKKDT